MATEVSDDPQESRYVVRVDGDVAGFTEYLLHRGVLALVHTEIAPEFGGQGLATTLIAGTLDDARARGLTVQPFCSFVRRFIAGHPDYLDLVIDADRERFGLD